MDLFVFIDSFRLVAECEALNLAELKDLALEMLHMYQRTEEQHYVTTYVQGTVRDYESWVFDRENGAGNVRILLYKINTILKSIFILLCCYCSRH